MLYVYIFKFWFWYLFVKLFTLAQQLRILRATCECTIPVWSNHARAESCAEVEFTNQRSLYRVSGHSVTGFSVARLDVSSRRSQQQRSHRRGAETQITTLESGSFRRRRKERTQFFQYCATIFRKKCRLELLSVRASLNIDELSAPFEAVGKYTVTCR